MAGDRARRRGDRAGGEDRARGGCRVDGAWPGCWAAAGRCLGVVQLLLADAGEDEGDVVFAVVA